MTIYQTIQTLELITVTGINSRREYDRVCHFLPLRVRPRVSFPTVGRYCVCHFWVHTLIFGLVWSMLLIFLIFCVVFGFFYLFRSVFCAQCWLRVLRDCPILFVSFSVLCPVLIACVTWLSNLICFVQCSVPSVDCVCHVIVQSYLSHRFFLTFIFHCDLDNVFRLQPRGYMSNIVRKG